MRVLLLGDSESIHFRKWAVSLAQKGFEIGIWSLNERDSGAYEALGIKVLSAGKQYNTLPGKADGKLIKSIYLAKLFGLKKAIKAFKPAILHAHYASSYGILGALSNFKPFIISVWGNDVYDFPGKSFLHAAILKFNLRRAHVILSTSNVMAAETKKYTGKQVEVTPFGVDTAVFAPCKPHDNEAEIVIGTIKALEDKYGITYLIEAFYMVLNRHPDLPLKLLIVGEGSKRKALEQQVIQLGLTNLVTFTGKVQHNKIAEYYNKLDIYVALSTLDSESFGVAIVEASSCALPVIVANVGGLPEVVIKNETGLVVPKENAAAAADAIEKLILDPALRKSMGEKGRQHVLKTYNWEDNVAQMATIYRRTAAQFSSIAAG